MRTALLSLARSRPTPLQKPIREQKFHSAEFFPGLPAAQPGAPGIRHVCPMAAVAVAVIRSVRLP
jgi:hypothetical protein